MQANYLTLLFATVYRWERRLHARLNLTRNEPDAYYILNKK